METEACELSVTHSKSHSVSPESGAQVHALKYEPVLPVPFTLHPAELELTCLDARFRPPDWEILKSRDTALTTTWLITGA